MSSAFNIPAGYKLVPLEPTESMLEAGVAAAVNLKNSGPWCPPCYRAMLSAAPHVDAVPGEPVALDELRATICGVGIVGQIDGDDVIRRESVIDLIDRRRLAASVASRAGSEPVTIPERNALLRLLVAEVTRLQTLFTDALGDTQQDSAPIAPAAAAEPSEPVLVMDDDELQDFCISLSFDQDDYTVDVIRNVERRMLGQPLFQCSVMSNAEMDAAPPSATAQAAPQTTAASTQALGEAGEAGEVKP